MFHCHIALHEDEGMMRQFVVTKTTSTNDPDEKGIDFTVYPNPVSDRLFISLSNTENKIYYARIINALGKTVMMLPRPDISHGIDISKLNNGIYFLQLTEEKTKKVTAKKFIVE